MFSSLAIVERLIAGMDLLRRWTPAKIPGEDFILSLPGNNDVGIAVELIYKPSATPTPWIIIVAIVPYSSSIGFRTA